MGMVFEDTCARSYTFAFGALMCQAQRAHVPGPCVFVIPRSSPAGHGGAGICERVRSTMAWWVSRPEPPAVAHATFIPSPANAIHFSVFFTV
jgi:hypothetical protein